MEEPQISECGGRCPWCCLRGAAGSGASQCIDHQPLILTNAALLTQPRLPYSGVRPPSSSCAELHRVLNWTLTFGSKMGLLPL